MELGESDVKDGGRTQILFLHCLRGKTLQTQNMELSFKLNTLLFFGKQEISYNMYHS